MKAFGIALVCSIIFALATPFGMSATLGNVVSSDEIVPPATVVAPDKAANNPREGNVVMPARNTADLLSDESRWEDMVVHEISIPCFLSWNGALYQGSGSIKKDRLGNCIDDGAGRLYAINGVDTHDRIALQGAWAGYVFRFLLPEELHFGATSYLLLGEPDFDIGDREAEELLGTTYGIQVYSVRGDSSCLLLEIAGKDKLWIIMCSSC